MSDEAIAIAPAAKAAAAVTTGEGAASKPAENLSAQGLTALFANAEQERRKSAGENAPGKDKAKAAPAKPASEARAAAPEEPGEGEGETPTEGDESGRRRSTALPEEETTPAGEEGAAAEEAAAAEGDEPPAEAAAAEAGPAEMPAELREAIAEAKAAGEKGKASLLQRVHKLCDQRDTERMQRLNAERELTETRAQLEQARKAPVEAAASPAMASDPVSGHPDVRKVSATIAEIDSYIAWAEANPDGGELPAGDGKTQAMDAAAVAKLLRNAERTRVELVAQRAQVTTAVQQQHDQTYRAFTAQAHKAYPVLAKADSPEGVLRKQFLDTLPQLKNFPDYELVIGDYLAGRNARLARDKAPVKKAAAAPAPARVALDVSGAPGKTTDKAEPEAKASDARQQFQKSGKIKDLGKSFAAQRLAKMTRK